MMLTVSAPGDTVLALDDTVSAPSDTVSPPSDTVPVPDDIVSPRSDAVLAPDDTASAVGDTETLVMAVFSVGGVVSLALVLTCVVAAILWRWVTCE